MQHIAFIETRAKDLTYLVYENYTLYVDCVTHTKHETIECNVKAVIYKSTSINLKVSVFG